MPHPITGIHHVTAVASHAQRNVDFYVGVLGLRLVKRTVNYDDPASYHLYYGDARGTLGSILTFFIWPEAPAGQRGAGVVSTVSLAIPQASLGYWLSRFVERGVRHELPVRRGDGHALSFTDPDGLALELVTVPAGTLTASHPWDASTVPSEHTIRAIHGVTLWETDAPATLSLFTESLGFHATETIGQETTLVTGTGGPGQQVTVRATQGFWNGSVGIGSVHHVAWRVPDSQSQVRWREHLVHAGLDVTQVRDRTYFRSIYLQEPGGVLLELATDGPGFTVDEPEDHLGARLALPLWLEPSRQALEQSLSAISLPSRAWKPFSGQ